MTIVEFFQKIITYSSLTPPVPDNHGKRFNQFLFSNFLALIIFLIFYSISGITALRFFIISSIFISLVIYYIVLFHNAFSISNIKYKKPFTLINNNIETSDDQRYFNEQALKSFLIPGFNLVFIFDIIIGYGVSLFKLKF